MISAAHAVQTKNESLSGGHFLFFPFSVSRIDKQQFLPMELVQQIRAVVWFMSGVSNSFSMKLAYIILIWQISSYAQNYIKILLNKPSEWCQNPNV